MSSMSSSSGFSTSTPQNMYSPQSDFALQIAQLAAQLAGNVYNWAQGQISTDNAMTDQSVQSYNRLENIGEGLTTQQLNDYTTMIRPELQSLKDQADTWNSSARQGVNEGMAEAAVTQGTQAGWQNAVQSLRAAGVNVDPSDPMYQNMLASMMTAGGASAAGAGQNARIATEEQGQQLRATSLQLGGQEEQQLSSTIANDLNSAYQGVAGAQNATLANAQTNANLQDAANPYLSTAMSLKYPPVGNTSTSIQHSQSSSQPAQHQPTSNGSGSGSGSGGGSGGGGSGNGGQPVYTGGDGSGGKGYSPVGVPQGNRNVPTNPQGDQTDQSAIPVIPSTGPYDPAFGGPPDWQSQQISGANAPLDPLNQLGSGTSPENNPQFDPLNQFGSGTNDTQPANPTVPDQMGSDPWLQGGFNSDPNVNSQSATPSDAAWGGPPADASSNPQLDPMNQFDSGSQDFSQQNSYSASDPWLQGGFNADTGASSSDQTQAPSQDYSSYDTSGGGYGSGDTSGGGDTYSPPPDYSGGGDGGGDTSSGEYGGAIGYAIGGPIRRPMPRNPQMTAIPPQMGPQMTTGGRVTPNMSPSSGQATDDVPARLNVGEYVIPKDVAAWKGHEFFQKMIDQSRKARMGATAKPQAKPALPNQQRPAFVSKRMG